jgi:signal transduction histidine kinase
VNEAYYRLAGRRDLIGRRLYDVFPEGVDQRFPKIRERVLRTGVPFVGREIPFELALAVGRRDVRFLDLTLLALTELDGTRSGIMLHGVDVTEHVHARHETELLLAESEAMARSEQDARSAAERAIQARDEVLRVISHELRAPLTVMKIAVDPLLDEPEPSPVSVQHSADLLKRSVDWMERLLGDLLDAASIEAGRLALAREHDSAADILTHAAVMFDGTARQGGIALESRAAPDLPVVFADRARVLQALSNLVTNAFKASCPGGRVTLRAERDQDGVRFSVEDTGSGIAAENLPHMFDRSWQQQHHANAGLGLGLAIVQGIVAAHGGQVGVESVLGQGSRFSFTIPAAPAGG